MKIGDSYEWIKTEKFGINEVIDEIKDNFVIFASGNRVRTNMLTQYLQYIGSNENYSPTKVEPTTELQVNGKTQTQLKKETVKSNNIYKDLIDKIEEVQEISLPITVTIALPKKEVVNILIKAYGDEMRKALSERIKEDIFTKQIEELYNNIIDKYLEDENN